MAHRLAGRCGYPEGDGFAVTLHPERLEEPAKWRKPERVFLCSMGDLFHDQVPDWFINAVWTMMFNNPQHTWLVLTKRPARLKVWTEIAAWFKQWPIKEIWPDWVWLGVTAEDQQRADERIPLLLQTLAAHRFVSVEPMLGVVDLRRYIGACNCPHDYYKGDGHNIYCPAARDYVGGLTRLDQVIAGAETGPKARPADLDWFRDLRDQCAASGTAFFLKQVNAKHEHLLDNVAYREIAA